MLLATMRNDKTITEVSCHTWAFKYYAIGSMLRWFAILHVPLVPIESGTRRQTGTFVEH